MLNAINRKYLVITVDTEEDNQWDNHPCFTTENSKYIPRFQKLCEKYGFKPVYFTTYPMAKDIFFVNFVKSKEIENKCEIGMHMHAWTTPPFHPIDSCVSKPFITEYPADFIEKKVQTITSFLENQFSIKVVSHRSGRWSLNNTYLQILKKYGYMVDCSVTPYVNWSKSKGGLNTPGTNYKKLKTNAFCDSFIEIPVSIIKKRGVFAECGFMRNAKSLLFGKAIWLRPTNDADCLRKMLAVVDGIGSVGSVLEFMIHSSELMPGCSPEFPDTASIERMYSNIESVFRYMAERGYIGVTAKEYYSLLKKCSI